MAVARISRAEAGELTRRRVLDAARAVFLRDGFHGASLDKVAEEAGYTKGAVYSRWESKADLFLSLLDEHVERRRAQMAEWELPAAGAPDEQARRIGRRWRAQVASERDWSLLFIEFWCHAARDERLREAFAQRHRALRANVVEAIRRTGGAPPEEAAERLATALIAMGNGFTLEALVDGAAVDETYVHMAGLLSRAVAKEEGTG